MTQLPPDQPGRYTGPPPMPPYAPPPQYGYQYGPPMAAYGYGYPPAYPYPPVAPRGPGRPGTLLAASIVAFVDAALLGIAGLFLLFAATIIGGIISADQAAQGFDAPGWNISDEFIVNGVLNILVSALLIAGGLMLDRGARGRILISVAAGICGACGLYWLTQFPSDAPFWIAIFCGCAIASVILVWLPKSTAWLQRP